MPPPVCLFQTWYLELAEPWHTSWYAHRCLGHLKTSLFPWYHKEGLDGKSYNHIYLRSSAKCLPHFRTSLTWGVCTCLSWVKCLIRISPISLLSGLRRLEIPGKQLRSNLRTLSKISLTFSPHLLPQMCGPEGSREFWVSSYAFPGNHKKTELSRQEAALGTAQPERGNQNPGTFATSSSCCLHFFPLKFFSILIFYFMLSYFLFPPSLISFSLSFFSLSASLLPHLYFPSPIPLLLLFLPPHSLSIPLFLDE